MKKKKVIFLDVNLYKIYSFLLQQHSSLRSKENFINDTSNNTNTPTTTKNLYLKIVSCQNKFYF